MFAVNWIKDIKYKYETNSFLIAELFKRDVKKKYKGTVLGMGWSMLGPLLNLFIMRLVFVQFFGRNVPHYTIYLFSGNIIMSYYREATKFGMSSLVGNASIFTKIKVPKYLFPLSQNIASFVNFLLTIVVYFIFVLCDGILPSWRWIALLYVVVLLFFFCLGVSMILSALQVFFRDTAHFYDIFLVLLTYCSAIFYSVDAYPAKIQRIFLCNPVYVYIKYFRVVVIDNAIPTPLYHGLCFFYAAVAIILGSVIYKTQNNKFLYHL